jgi:DNA-binding beta-propeller fold protein YncE
MVTKGRDKAGIAAGGRARRCATALLAAAALALAGCNRTEHAPNGTSQTGQGVAPTAVSPAGYVYITNNGEGTISEFRQMADGSLNFLRVEKTGSVNGPTGISIDPTSRFLYVANEGDGRIHQFRIRRDTGGLAAINAGSVNDGPANRPQQIAISPRGDFVYVTNSGKRGTGVNGSDKNGEGSIAEYTVDLATGALKLLETFRGGGLQQPLGIASLPNGKFVYVSDPGAGTLLTFAVEPSGRLRPVASTPSLGDKQGAPGLVAVHPSGSFVYTVDRSAGVVVVASPAADGHLAVTKTFHVGISTAGPFAITGATVGPNVFLYTANQVADTVSSLVVKPDGLDLVGESPTGMGFPTGMAADAGGRNLYVVNREASTVTQFAIAQTNGIALTPAASIFTEAAPSKASHPLYIATTRWATPPAPVATSAPRMN